MEETKEINETAEHDVFIQGEQPVLGSHFAGTFLAQSFQIAKGLLAKGHEIFSPITTEDGFKVELTPYNHVLRPDEKTGFFRLHMRTKVDDADGEGKNHKKVLVSMVVAGGAVLACAGAIRQREKSKTPKKPKLK